MSTEPSIEQQIAELERCHWTRQTSTIWKSPSGKLFVGPHGAWKAMRSSEVFRRILGEALEPASLKPCPFCGNTEPILDCLTDEDDYFVRCPSCEVQQIASDTRDSAVSQWNRRAHA